MTTKERLLALVEDFEKIPAPREKPDPELAAGLLIRHLGVEEAEKHARRTLAIILEVCNEERRKRK